jgi:phosphoglucomutase
LSGTGTSGATLRVYLERHDAKRIDAETQAALKPLIAAADALTGMTAAIGRAQPDVIT